MDETTTIVAVTVGVCLGAAALGGLVLHLVRMRALVWSIVVAALIPILAVSASLLLNVQLMFVSAHDSSAVSVALVCATVVGALLSVILGRRVAAGSARLVRAMHDLGTTTQVPRVGVGTTPGDSRSAGLGAPGEIAVLAAELDATRGRLADAQQRSAELEAGRRQLVAFLSHDLRTPLAGLQALTEGLQDGVVEDQPDALRQMRSTVQRMTGLVGDLFELSNLQSDTSARAASAVSVTEVLHDVGDQARAIAARVPLEVVVQTPDDDRLTVRADAEKVQRAVLNLAVNAVHHTPPHGSVLIRAIRAEDASVVVQVSDGCGGIPGPDLPLVFDVGWRGSSPRPAPGAGLGLAIARSVAQAHGGSISVVNIRGGCRFQIRLPAAVAQ